MDATIVALYERATDHADWTIKNLELDAIGRVPWWPEDRSRVTLHRILVHVIAETNRHAGHADVVRELIDGKAGLREDNDNMPPADATWWAAYRERLESVPVQVPDARWAPQYKAYGSPCWLLVQYMGPPHCPQTAMPARDHLGERALVGTMRCASRRRW